MQKLSISDEMLLEFMPYWEKMHEENTNTLTALFANADATIKDKVKQLNRLYRTRLSSKSIDAAIEILTEFDNICDLLNHGNIEVVDEIRRRVKGKKDKNGKPLHDCLVFVSKYCTFCNPNKFIIYDSYVAGKLQKINKIFKFTKHQKSSYFKRNTDYKIWLDIVHDFKEFFAITLDSRTLDKCLWGWVESEKSK